MQLWVVCTHFNAFRAKLPPLENTQCMKKEKSHLNAQTSHNNKITSTFFHTVPSFYALLTCWHFQMLHVNEDSKKGMEARIRTHFFFWKMVVREKKAIICVWEKIERKTLSSVRILKDSVIWIWLQKTLACWGSGCCVTVAGDWDGGREGVKYSI